MANDSAKDEPIVRLRQGDPLHRFILDTFAATGRSPSVDEIRSRFSLSSTNDADERVAALERTGAIHRNAGDRLITHAYPFSNEPTAHRVKLAGGPAVFAMCAIDALGMPFMLRRDASIESACAGCGAEVRVTIESNAIVQHAPANTVVWLAERNEGCVAATDLCPNLNFFCSPKHLAAWQQHSGGRGEELSMAQALARGRSTFERLMDDSAAAAD